MGNYTFLARALAVRRTMEDMRGTLLVDTYDGAPINMNPFRQLNPFHCWPTPVLSVPGTDLLSTSVEGIWQGLKIVDGSTEFSQFVGLPSKRPSDTERRVLPNYEYRRSRFLYNGEAIDLVTARFIIYSVAYMELLDRVIDRSLIDYIRDQASNNEVIFFDWDGNGDIINPETSFSHSALLRAWFAGELKEFLFLPARRFLHGRYICVFEDAIDTRLGRYVEAH